MAKVVPFPNQQHSLPRTRGGFLIQQGKHGAYAAKWPRKRGKATSGYDFYRQTEFGIAARWASSPNGLDLWTAVEMAKGTEQVPRDILQMASMGVYYRFDFPDGRQWRGGRELTNNPQWFMDLITTTPGSVVIRDDIGWVGLDPGPETYVLTMQGGRPAWAAGGGGGGGGVPPWLAPDYQQSNSSGIGCRGIRVRPQVSLTIDAIAVTGWWQAGQDLGLRIFEAFGNTLGTLVQEPARVAISANRDGDIMWELDNPLLLDAGSDHWFVSYNLGGADFENLRAFSTTEDWPGIVKEELTLGGYGITMDPVAGTSMSTGGAKIALRFRQVA